jgi:hypothetical protein
MKKAPKETAGLGWAHHSKKDGKHGNHSHGHGKDRGHGKDHGHGHGGHDRGGGAPEVEERVEKDVVTGPLADNGKKGTPPGSDKFSRLPARKGASNKVVPEKFDRLPSKKGAVNPAAKQSGGAGKGKGKRKADRGELKGNSRGKSAGGTHKISRSKSRGKGRGKGKSKRAD